MSEERRRVRGCAMRGGFRSLASSVKSCRREGVG